MAVQHSNSMAGDHALEYAGDAIVMRFRQGYRVARPGRGAIGWQIAFPEWLWVA
jgi:hypothetical protein